MAPRRSRSGTEPVTARPVPVGLRVAIAAFGLLASSFTTVWLIRYARDAPDDAAAITILAACTGVAAAAAVVNLTVLIRRLRRPSSTDAADGPPGPPTVRSAG